MRIPVARLSELLWLWLCLLGAAAPALSAPAPAPAPAPVPAPAPAPLPGPKKANHELLTSLGLVRRRAAAHAHAHTAHTHTRAHAPSNAHHRKRLAGAEQRSAADAHAPDDSHMVVIKLPPAPYYYAHEPPSRHNAVSKLPVHFRGNGKPTGVYHWNLPVLKKMKAAGGHARRGSADIEAEPSHAHPHDSKIFHIQNTSPFAHHAHDNDILKGAESAAKPTYAHKYKVSYYSPRRKTLFQKRFQGNGKPNSFYVIEKSKKPIHYHRLLP